MFALGVETDKIGSDNAAQFAALREEMKRAGSLHAHNFDEADCANECAFIEVAAVRVSASGVEGVFQIHPSELDLERRASKEECSY